MAKKDLEKWTTDSSEYLVHDRWLKLRIDSCTTPDGHKIEPFYIFEYPDWANCVVIDDSQNIILVNQYRHGVDKYILELVSGGLEPNDVSPEDGMKRELKEEIGYVGGNIYRTGSSYPNPSSQTNKVYSFIAVGGNCKLTQTLEKGETLDVVKMPLKEFVHMLTDSNSGNIFQSLHLAAVFFALNFIKESDTPEVQALKPFV